MRTLYEVECSSIAVSKHARASSNFLWLRYSLAFRRSCTVEVHRHARTPHRANVRRRAQHVIWARSTVSLASTIFCSMRGSVLAFEVVGPSDSRACAFAGAFIPALLHTRVLRKGFEFKLFSYEGA